jgi:hypothetical protein
VLSMISWFLISRCSRYPALLSGELEIRTGYAGGARLGAAGILKAARRTRASGLGADAAETIARIVRRCEYPKELGGPIPDQ